VFAGLALSKGGMKESLLSARRASTRESAGRQRISYIRKESNE
jgi:hypothetical protein